MNCSGPEKGGKFPLQRHSSGGCGCPCCSALFPELFCSRKITRRGERPRQHRTMMQPQSTMMIL